MDNKQSRGKARSIRRKIIIGIEVLLMLVVVIGGYAWSKINKFNKVDLNTDEIVVNDELDETKLSGFTNIALFGMDSREGLKESGSNSDTMIVASINNDSGEINMVSLYRDTYMDLGNGTYSKANAAYAYNGAEQALSMLNKSMDLNVTNFIATDFKALTVCIDCLGGLDVDMTAEEVVWMNGYICETSAESGIWSETLDDEIWDGVHHLNGTQATAFCRIRYTVGDDYKRTERQRLILSLIFEKAKTMDFATLNKIADEVFPLVYTNLNLAEIVKIGKSIMGYSMNESFGVPENRITGNIGKCGDCVVPTDWASEVIKIHEVLFKDMNYTPSSTVYSISNYIAGVEVTKGSTEDSEDSDGTGEVTDGSETGDGTGDGENPGEYIGEEETGGGESGGGESGGGETGGGETGGGETGGDESGGGESGGGESGGGESGGGESGGGETGGGESGGGEVAQ